MSQKPTDPKAKQHRKRRLTALGLGFATLISLIGVGTLLFGGTPSNLYLIVAWLVSMGVYIVTSP